MRRECNGILAIWHDVAERDRRETLAWYDREHHLERVGVPGFLSARRYSAITGSPELFIRYETDDPGVLSSEAYLARLNQPTAWSLRRQPTIVNNSRTVCSVAARSGLAEGGFAATFRLDSPDGGDPLATVGWAGLVEAFAALWGALSLELWVADRERSTLASWEKELRGVADQHAGMALIAHASAREPLADLLERWSHDLAERAGAPVAAGLYGLAFVLEGPAEDLA